MTNVITTTTTIIIEPFNTYIPFGESNFAFTLFLHYSILKF